MSKDKEPKTLQQAILFFSSYEKLPHRLHDGLALADGKVQCPTCGSFNVEWLPNAKCSSCY